MEKFDEAAKDFAKSVTLSTSFAVAHAQKCYAGRFMYKYLLKVLNCFG